MIKEKTKKNLERKIYKRLISYIYEAYNHIFLYSNDSFQVTQTFFIPNIFKIAVFDWC